MQNVCRIWTCSDGLAYYGKYLYNLVVEHRATEPEGFSVDFSWITEVWRIFLRPAMSKTILPSITRVLYAIDSLTCEFV